MLRIETEVVNEHGSCLDTLVHTGPLLAGASAKIATMNVDFNLPQCDLHRFQQLSSTFVCSSQTRELPATLSAAPGFPTYS